MQWVVSYKKCYVDKNNRMEWNHENDYCTVVEANDQNAAFAKFESEFPQSEQKEGFDCRIFDIMVMPRV